MKLYYTPRACSLSPHIVLRELGLQFDLECVDLATKKTASGRDYLAINPNGYVPALELDNGEVITEGAAIVQYLADQKPEAGLAPPPGTLQRTRLQERINFIASELHKSFTPFFQKDTSEHTKAAATAHIASRFDYLESILADGRPYLMGDAYTVVDPYLFIVSSWAKPSGIELGKWPKLAAYIGRIAQRETVNAAMRAEGLA
jgi:glutathione S-transferase